MEDDRVLRGPDPAVVMPEFQKNLSVIEILFRAMKNNGDSIAQIEADMGKTATFCELLKQSINIAANLRKHGITEGDIVVICLEKSIVAYSILAAVIFTGATAALWGTFFSQDDIQLQIKANQPKCIICSKEMHKKISLPEDVQEPIVFFEDGTSPNLESNILSEESDQDFNFYHVKDIQNHFPLILFTSGTTGPSKAVVIPNNALQRYGHRFADEAHKFLVMSPFCWISSSLTFISSVLQNYTMVLSSSDPTLHLEHTEHYKIDTWMITPSKMIALLNIPNISSYDLSSVKTVIGGGGPLSFHLKKKFIENVFHNNINLWHLYGSTEAGVLTTYIQVDPELAIQSASCGKLQSGAQLKVVDENGQSVGPRIEGEIRVKTDTMMAKYVEVSGAVSHPFDSQGWFLTGDVGYYDENGLIYVLGRSSDRIQYKDKKLSPIHIEGLLLTHPDVYDAVVVARPHSVDNQHLAAFVELRPNSKTTAEAIQKYIDDQVEDVFKLRGGVHFVDTIPKLTNGKVLKHILQKKFQD